LSGATKRRMVPRMRGRLGQNLAFVVRRPRLALRAALSALATRAGRPRLRALDVDVTNRCPLRCAHCYAADFPVDRAGELTPADIARLGNEARALGAVQANLSGGEALVRRDLEAIVAGCRGAGLLVSLCTSAAGLTARRFASLAAAGLDVVILSLDSVDAAVHDANRGRPGLHANVLAAIAGARRLGVTPMVNTVATREKLASGELERMRELVTGAGALLNLTMPTAIGRWDGAAGDVALQAAEREAVAAFLRRPGVRTDTFSVYGAPGCPAGTEKISVGADGIAHLCPLVPGAWGDVRREPLRTIWARARAGAASLRREPFCPAALPGAALPAPPTR
jgi:MoaA/NifB/PqqE/SkfB family radical SAM enzyme